MATFTVHRDFIKFQPTGFRFGDYDDPECFDVVAENVAAAKQIVKEQHNKNPWYFKFVAK